MVGAPRCAVTGEWLVFGSRGDRVAVSQDQGVVRRPLRGRGRRFAEYAARSVGKGPTETDWAARFEIAEGSERDGALLAGDGSVRRAFQLASVQRSALDQWPGVRVRLGRAALHGTQGGSLWRFQISRPNQITSGMSEVREDAEADADSADEEASASQASQASSVFWC